MLQERLQKILANAGIASRRAAEEMIRSGRVSVNGKVVKELGSKADPLQDEIRVDGRLVSTEVARVYILLNKPPGYITSLKDPEKRPVVSDLLGEITERVFPVGRLDYDSEGLIIMTNDGEFAQKLQHPRYRIPRTYRVKVQGRLSRTQIREIEKGIELEDGLFKPAEIFLEKSNPRSTWVRMTISEGRNRVIRRMFDKLGHFVQRLIRISIADVHLGDLKPGEYRPLKRKEIERLTRARY